MAFAFFKRIRKAFKKRLPYILVIIQPHPELSEALCGHQATPLSYDIVTLESTQIHTDEPDESVRSVSDQSPGPYRSVCSPYIASIVTLSPPQREFCTCSQNRQHEIGCTMGIRREGNGPTFYCMVEGEDVKIHPPPFEILRQLKKEQTMADALDLEYKLKTGVIQWQEVAEMSMAESGIMSESEWGTVETDTPSAEWEHGYGGRLCDSGWPNSQRSSEQHNYHEDAFEGGHRNLAIPSQLSSSSLVQSPSMLPRNNHLDGIDFDLLDLAMDSLDRLQEVLDEALEEGEAKDGYADVVEAEGSGWPTVARKRIQDVE
ncbi:uncharacterized protein LAESUDRAFT_305913 [Laetiporus sulphureus 93-53]|uniref:Uncharacterized protein n=1 Tax=Laetiporus sulphureus 93-53 TaxID=1314785 RepID=A0A165D8R7_9APHY|nr:uncharacterized protein LAESUDRAFT_305913 [Laetiporus sulphureus 93-53]KZT04349.1 hypothetical protein LAESUDRAFT_305913 [Laetiporus sulphureus 93-53]